MITHADGYAERNAGKTHLTIALGTEAIVTGSSVYFVTIQDLAAQFERAQDENKLKERMSLLVKPKLLIPDEMGYLSLDSFAATCLFQRVSEPYEKGSIILTSNKSYSDRGRHLRRQRDRLGHPRPAAAPLHHHQHQGQELPTQG